ncbi:two-component system, response regulator YesN [Candidatus Frackibacter sp. WG12]|nr:two-component system, response regulator YesN [Candidatus Frackibacter sp. WG11]SEM36179.1 two-component system, response regulator YesN [Candidatus Frackibacter sp. WG12]SFL41417.1 two-component system, response regulator YesN [Candidatus Frackibacter sp. WG13]
MMYKALVVDDEQLERRVMKKIITDEVQEVRLVGEAENGNEALIVAEAERPDIILMDIKMPKVDGLEATKEIAKLYPSIKIIIITAYNEFDYAQRALKYGAVDYLLKPVKPEKIIEVLDELITKIEEERLYNQLVKQGHDNLEESAQFHQKVFAKEKKLYELVKEGEVKEIGSFVDQLLDEIQQDDYELVKVKIRIIEFLVSLSRTINQEAEIEICHFYFEELISESAEINSMNQFASWVKNKLKIVVDKVTKAYDEIEDDIIKQATNYINRNYDQDLTLERVAKAVHLNPSYLSHTFKEETGSNFTDYLTKIRLKKAQELLKTSKSKITEIAHQVGYQNSNYFSQVFKKEFGLTPTQYRKEKRNF